MKTRFGIVAVLFIILGFGMVHGSPSMVPVAIGLMGIGIVYLLFLLFSSRRKRENEKS
jgi:hypothetical protein